MIEKIKESTGKIRKHTLFLCTWMLLPLINIGLFTTNYHKESMYREILFSEDQQTIKLLKSKREAHCKDMDAVLYKSVSDDLSLGRKVHKDYEKCKNIIDSIVAFQSDLYNNAIQFNQPVSEFQKVPFVDVSVRRLYFPMIVKVAYLALLISLFIEFSTIQKLKDEKGLIDQESFINESIFQNKIQHFSFSTLCEKILKRALIAGGVLLTIGLIFESFNYLVTVAIYDQFGTMKFIIGILNLSAFSAIVWLTILILRKLNLWSKIYN